MKKLLTILAFLVCATSLSAQEKQKESKEKMTHHATAMKDCVMMEDGKMMVMKGGESMPMDQDMTLSNGTMVMKDGKVMMKNGKSKMLKNGDCVYMDGKMGHMSGKMKMSKGKKM